MSVLSLCSPTASRRCHVKWVFLKAGNVYLWSVKRGDVASLRVGSDTYATCAPLGLAMTEIFARIPWTRTKRYVRHGPLWTGTCSPSAASYVLRNPKVER